MQCLRTMTAAEPLCGVAYDPNSEYLATMSVRGTLQIWDLTNGKVVHSEAGAGPKARSPRQPPSESFHQQQRSVKCRSAPRMGVGLSLHNV
jgi:WD40 repeat protein